MNSNPYSLTDLIDPLNICFVIEFESIVSGAFGDESSHYITIVLFPFMSAMIL